MTRWWKARTWEQKLGMGTLIVTVLGTLIVPVYLDLRDDGSPRSDAAAPTTASPSSSPLSSVAPTTTSDPYAAAPATSGEETGPEAARPLTPDGKVVRYLSDMEPVDGENPSTGAFSVNGVAHAHSLAYDHWLTPYATEYDLGRAFDTFKVTIGLRDDSSAAGRTKFECSSTAVAPRPGRCGWARRSTSRSRWGAFCACAWSPLRSRPSRCTFFSTFGDARVLGDPAKVPPTT